MVLIKTWNGIEGNFAEGNFDTKQTENFEYEKTQKIMLSLKAKRAKRKMKRHLKSFHLCKRK